MEFEKRRHPRFSPIGLTATIDLSPVSSDEEIHLQGTVIDLSYSGIKIKLFSEMPEELPKSKIKIYLTIPDTGIQVTINGMVKHVNNKSEYGLKYSEQNAEQEVDALMFECIKSVNN